MNVRFVLQVRRGPRFHITKDRGQRFPGIALVTEGRSRLRLGGESHTLTAGTVWITGLDHRSELRSDPVHPPAMFHVGLSGAEAEDLLGRRCGFGVWRPARPHVVRRLLESMHDEAGLHVQDQQAVLRSQLDTLLRLLARRADDSAGDDRARARFERCCTHVVEHVDSLRTVRDLCTAMAISRTHLDRLFRRYLDRSPQEWLRAQRMAKVCELLSDPTLTLVAIAERLGFSSPFALSRSFKAVFGIAPSTWRDEVMD